MSNPKKWTDVYPQGTKEGDEEQKFFIVLARHKSYTWRSIAALVKETGLTETRVRELIAKYEKRGMVFKNPANEKQWGYWERNQDDMPKAVKSLSDIDKKNRIKGKY